MCGCLASPTRARLRGAAHGPDRAPASPNMGAPRRGRQRPSHRGRPCRGRAIRGWRWSSRRASCERSPFRRGWVPASPEDVEIAGGRGQEAVKASRSCPCRCPHGAASPGRNLIKASWVAGSSFARIREPRAVHPQKQSREEPTEWAPGPPTAVSGSTTRSAGTTRAPVPVPLAKRASLRCLTYALALSLDAVFEVSAATLGPRRGRGSVSAPDACAHATRAAIHCGILGAVHPAPRGLRPEPMSGNHRTAVITETEARRVGELELGPTQAGSRTGSVGRPRVTQSCIPPSSGSCWQESRPRPALGSRWVTVCTAGRYRRGSPVLCPRVRRAGRPRRRRGCSWPRQRGLLVEVRVRPSTSGAPRATSSSSSCSTIAWTPGAGSMGWIWPRVVSTATRSAREADRSPLAPSTTQPPVRLHRHARDPRDHAPVGADPAARRC